MWVDVLGFWALSFLLLVLPFDPSGYPVFALWGAEVTPPDLVFLMVGLLAVLTLARDAPVQFGRRGRPPRQTFGDHRQGIAGGLLAATLLSMIVTAALAGQVGSTAVWLLNVAAGGCVALALPRWRSATRPVSFLAAALVAGAVISALLGFGEFLIGAPIERMLVVFRPGPTTMGPYLRLTSVFHHTNIAAMYFELALPFAVAGLVAAVRREPIGSGRRGSLPIVLWGAAINILLLALLLTYSRGAVLGVLAALAVAAWTLRGMVGERLSVVALRWLLIGGANLALLLGLFLASTSSIEAVRLTSGTDESWYRVGYAGSPPAAMRPGAQAAVHVTVQNLSPLSWQSQRRGDYALSYHWLEPSFRVARFDTTLTPLPSSVPSGARRTVVANVVAPAHPGRYILVWDLLWHQRTWFDLKTGELTPHFVDVAGLPVADAPPAGSFSQPGDAGLVTLPVNQVQGRTSIWEVGVRVFFRRPLFGGGLHAYFTDFRSFVSLTPGARPPPHAHDLVLALLDSWGLAGTLLLAGLGIALCWPLLGVARRGRASSVWPVAVLAGGAAFLAHGTVDYFFGATPVFGLVWVLGGLALAARD